MPEPRADVIPCPTPECGTTLETVGALAAHFYDDERVKAGPALWLARRTAGIPYLPSAGEREGPRTRQARSQIIPGVCRWCLRLKEPCKRHGGRDHSTAAQYAAPARATPFTPWAHKTAAHRLGISVAEYEAHRAEGKKWCFRCRRWHLKSAFGNESQRADGLSGSCRESKNTKERRLYAVRGRA